MAEGQKIPLFSFGVVADVQHSESEDGFDFFRTTLRRYRGAAIRLDEACKHFHEKNVDFIAQLGDLIDGKSRNPEAGTEHMTEDERAERIWDNNLVACFERNGFEFYGKNSGEKEKFVHGVVGNHELYCFSRPKLAQKLHTPNNNNRHYYSFTPHPNFRILLLDTYDFSALNGDKEEERRAFDLLEKYNPNDVTSNCDWLKGLEGVDKRWMPYNGRVEEEQMAWLEEELQKATEQDQKVIVLSHCLLYEKGVAREGSLAWNYEEILSLLRDKKRVVAVLTGHDHRHGHSQDEFGIHHWSVPSILESEVGAHAVVEVYSDRLCIRGVGDIDSFVWEF